MITRFGIVAKENELSNNIANIISKRLEENKLIRDDLNPQLVISVGGDGTMLFAVHKYESILDQVYFLGVHTGTLGFYTDYQKNEIETLISDIISNRYEVTNRTLLDIEIYGKEYIHTFALNEFRIENPYITQVLRVYVNGEYLETFRGSGVCVSTPSGSTAFNKSLGGAVISPDLDVMQITEIASIGHNAYRSLGSSIILSKDQEIVFDFERSKGAVTGLDHITVCAEGITKVKIKTSNHYVRCIQYRPFSFISRIRRTFIS